MNLNTVSTFFALGALMIGAAVIVVAAIAVLARFSEGAARIWESIVISAGPQALWLGWVMAVIATLGSLYYSEVADLVPCTLCWYQRIAMYPWAIVLGIMAWNRERFAARYTLPVVIIGFGISTYHYLLQRFPDALPEAACSATVPCSAAYIWKFDLVSIPFMAGVSFAAICTTLLIHRAWLARLEEDGEPRTMVGTEPEEPSR
ncbi:MAG TPA: disulfide oxidoreductase [Acidimicrobiia bacterium]|nr:disulfide oxidoreductase [Acidimicrobiia bacterium]